MTQRRWPGIIAALVLALMLLGVGYVVAGNVGSSDLGQQVALALAFAAFGVVGAVIVAKRPDNRFGWLFSAIGVLAIATASTEHAMSLVITDLQLGRKSGWLTTALMIYGNGFWYPFFGLFFILVPLLYPTGRALSRRWAKVGWFGMGVLVAEAVLGMLQPTFEDEQGSIENPIGISGMPHPETSSLGNLLLTTGLLAGVLAVVSVVVRYRRAGRVERLQIKWLMYSFVLLILWILLAEVLWVDVLGHATPPGEDLGFSLIMLAIPVAAGVAILRYRLYDIDRIISRTITYSMLVLLLAGFYIGGVFSLTRLVPATGDLAVAASTLAVAAVFNPLRSRIRDWVDHRFNRSRYDAARLFDSFAGKLQSGTDLPQIVSDFQTVVTRSIEPATASVWVRKVST